MAKKLTQQKVYSIIKLIKRYPSRDSSWIAKKARAKKMQVAGVKSHVTRGTYN